MIAVTYENSRCKVSTILAGTVTELCFPWACDLSKALASCYAPVTKSYITVSDRRDKIAGRAAEGVLSQGIRWPTRNGEEATIVQEGRDTESREVFLGLSTEACGVFFLVRSTRPPGSAKSGRLPLPISGHVKAQTMSSPRPMITQYDKDEAARDTSRGIHSSRTVKAGTPHNLKGIVTQPPSF